ncbi:hypothetical protein [Morganella morganii IS15]|nr:hypothetical protein [Morganella morganii IS15]
MCKNVYLSVYCRNFQGRITVGSTLMTTKMSCGLLSSVMMQMINE